MSIIYSLYHNAAKNAHRREILDTPCLFRYGYVSTRVYLRRSREKSAGF